MRPEPVSGGLVMIVALVGIIINGSIAFLFSQDKDLHMRSAFLSMAFDTLASLGALLAGVIIYFTHKTIADPIASIVIGILLIVSAWGVLEDSLHILLEGVPKGIDIKKVETCIKKTEHVKEMDDLHVWSLSSRDIALSCHIILDECNLIKSTNIVKNIKQNLQKQFDIYHATIEVELTGCNPIK
jgi:cobalt-zinc-cadmium efflux system protein